MAYIIAPLLPGAEVTATRAGQGRPPQRSSRLLAVVLVIVAAAIAVIAVYFVLPLLL